MFVAGGNDTTNLGAQVRAHLILHRAHQNIITSYCMQSNPFFNLPRVTQLPKFHQQTKYA